MEIERKENALGHDIGIVVALLMALGTVFVFSASANLSQEFDFHKFYNFQSLRRILFFPMAVGLMFAVSCFDYRRFSAARSWWRTPVSYMLGFSVLLLVMVLIPKFGTEVNQARRWIRIPVGSFSISFQPSELAKWSLLFFMAAYCARYADELALFFKRFLPVCAVIALVAGLVIMEDFGTAALITLLSFSMLLIAGVKWWHVLGPMPVGLTAFLFAILSSETRKNRITAFLHPDKWVDSINFQPSQSLIALGSGGLWGKGLGKGICKYGHLPEDTNDFLFAIIGEELGFVGTAAVICLFIVFVWLGMLVVVRCRDRFGQLLAAGIVLAIGIQAVLNIGVVTVVLPTKGIPLPFVSAGGTSMLLSAVAVGVLLNIAKQSPIPDKKER